jgi:hypothetical protein
MILIKNDHLIKVISFGFATGITLFPFIITTKNTSPVVINHERIHLRQQAELWVIFFYIWYLVEWLCMGYRKISFEKEAYANERDLTYLSRRRKYSFYKYAGEG